MNDGLYYCANCGKECSMFGHTDKGGDFTCRAKQPEPKKEKPMIKVYDLALTNGTLNPTPKSTHWIHADTESDSLPESLQYSPEDAAEQYLSDADFATTSWDDRDELLSEGHVDIKLIGLTETTELIDDPDEQFDGYEPGQMWYKKTGEKATVRVSLKFEVIDSMAEKVGGGE